MSPSVERGDPDADAPLDEHVDASEPVADAADDSRALRRARRRAGWLSVGLLGIAVVLTVSVLIDPVRPWFQPFDEWWLEFASSHRSGTLTTFAEAFDVAGSTVVTVPVRILALIVLVARRRWTQTLAFVTAVVLSELCIGPLKALVDRARPPTRIVETTSASFPSGHAVAAAVTAFGLVIAFLPRGRRRLHWVIGAALIAGCMAWSRTYLGAHWATDTIAGVCIGVGFAVGVDVLLESLRTEVAESVEPTEVSTSVDGAVQRPQG